MTEVPLPSEPSEPRGNNDRPLGVTLIALLQYLQAIILIVAGIASFIVPVFGIIVGIPFLIIGLVLFYIGKGIWEMQNWAWLWAIIVNIIGAIAALAGSNWFSLVLSIIIVLYLNTEDVKTRFGR